MLNAFKRLKRKRLEEIRGRTPIDWDLQDDDGVRGVYLELVVAPDTKKEWRDFLDSRGSILKEATARGVARSASQQNGFRRFKGRRQPAVEQELEKAFLAAQKRPRAERLKETQEVYNAVRKHLLIDAYVCTTDLDPFDLGSLWSAAKMASTGDSEEAHAAALKALDEALSPEHLLAIAGEPVERRPIEPGELDAFFVAEHADDPEPHLVPKTWSYALGHPGGRTFSDVLVACVQELAGKASEGIAIERAAEVDEGKEMPTSGRGAPRPGAKAKKGTTSALASKDA